MKLLVLLFLVGCAIASPIYDIHDVLEDAADEVYHDFMTSLDDAGAQVFADENDIKTEVGQKLKDALSKVLERIKDAVDQGKVVGEDLQNKLKELKEKLKEMKIDMGDKARELMDKLREKTRDFIKDLLDKLGVKGSSKRSVQHAEIQQIEINLKDLFRKLKKELLKGIDKEALKAKIEKIFGKGSEMTNALEELINKKGAEYKQKLLDLIDRFLGKEEQFAEQHSLGEYWQKIKDYFKDLKIDLQEKYLKFGEWVKKFAKETLDKGKGKMDNIKQIANEFLKHTKDVSKEVAVEALEFLRPYKEDLGSLYDQVKETVKDILKRKD
nr:laminin subunit alpha-2 [Parasteatoda tepidariorum]